MSRNKNYDEMLSEACKGLKISRVRLDKIARKKRKEFKGLLSLEGSLVVSSKQMGLDLDDHYRKKGRRLFW